MPLNNRLPAPLLSLHTPVRTAQPQTILDPELMKFGIGVLERPPAEGLCNEQFWLSPDEKQKS